MNGHHGDAVHYRFKYTKSVYFGEIRKFLGAIICISQKKAVPLYPMTKNLYISLLLVLCNLAAYSSSLREAQETVRQADSLWHAGQMYDDSAALAQTYETLDAWRYFYADDYAHACYHYGKLLRAQDDPVSAMQAFIHATHSRTRDYHILGRIYNNMGDICHRAGEFPLSYEMFEKSGDMFLREQDTLSYYYCLNDMALELAEQGRKMKPYHY